MHFHGKEKIRMECVVLQIIIRHPLPLRAGQKAIKMTKVKVKLTYFLAQLSLKCFDIIVKSSMTYLLQNLLYQNFQKKKSSEKILLDTPGDRKLPALLKKLAPHTHTETEVHSIAKRMNREKKKKKKELT